MRSGELRGDLLKAVSRSFYLSLRVLPSGVRQPMGLAYLLARASDTIADSSEYPVQMRVRHLENFARMVRDGDETGLKELQTDIRPTHTGESALIARLGECLDALNATAPQDSQEIRQVLTEIIRGQTLDLQRFTAAPGEIVALSTAAELEEYTYLVAGCVGGFWTRICLLHLPAYSRIDATELVRIGTDFGKGLQLVNILRDLPEDLRNGRCYLPLEELSSVGLPPGELLVRPDAAQPVFAQWLGRAEFLLDHGRQYVAAIRPARVRLACFLPWYIGQRTLEMLGRTPPLQAQGRVKVPRSTVRAGLLLGAFAAFSNLPLRSPR